MQRGKKCQGFIRQTVKKCISALSAEKAVMADAL